MHEPNPFTGLIDLAAEKLGGRTLEANDAFFASETNLLKPGRGIFIPDKFTEQGKWMDGWETRRRRTPGHDWCVIRLGAPGKVKGLDIDTNHFLGNHPPYASVDGCRAKAAPAPNPSDWTEILAKSPLQPGSHNLFCVESQGPWTHLRLNIYPDGGVARFRAFGQVAVDPADLRGGEPVDLAALIHGGRVVACNDMFFGDRNNLIMPGSAATMGEGWETRRRRVPGHDWCVLRLACPGVLQSILIDTRHFKGNYPESCWLEACFAPDIGDDALVHGSLEWREILSGSKLGPHREHRFEKEILAHGPVSHVRLNIFPDGGVSRLRLFGRPSP